jgi:hypothetical protein
VICAETEGDEKIKFFLKALTGVKQFTALPRNWVRQQYGNRLFPLSCLRLLWVHVLIVVTMCFKGGEI